MKYLILLLLFSCGTETVPKKPINNPVKIHVGVKTCKDIASKTDKYSSHLAELICELRLSKQNPKLKSIVLAQWILESGWGKSSLATKHYNFGGLKWRKEMSKYAVPVVYKAHDGITRYNKFKSAKDFIEGYWHFIDRYPYRGWDAYKDSPVKYLKFIVKSGYCPDNGYIESVLKLQKAALKILK